MTRSTRKLSLRTETLRPLTDDALRRVGGGFIMRDSIIVRTGRVSDVDPLPIDGQP